MSKRNIDTRLDFLSPISLIPGLGPKRISALQNSGLNNIGDLIYYYPLRYIDRSVIAEIGQLQNYIGKTCSVIGTITKTRVERGRRSKLRIQVEDDSGTIECLWFKGIQFFRKSLIAQKHILMTGTVSTFGNNLQMIHPTIESVPKKNSLPTIKFLPIYPLSSDMRDARLTQKQLQKTIKWILTNIKHYPQILPNTIIKKKKFPPLDTCLKQIHFPDNLNTLGKFKERLKYEELYQLALTLRWSKRKFLLPGRSLNGDSLINKIKNILPFNLTDDQNSALKILLRKINSNTRMHSILQGDVGSGKTIVSFMACLPAINNGLQVVWLTPTEVLAKQTHKQIKKWCSELNIDVDLLTGNTTAIQKQKIKTLLKNGTLQFIVGTHALLQSSVSFSKIGMIVIDEQHKFGSEQRLKITQKDPASDFLLMSATPIPQSLASTLYSDLDLVTIRNKPKGRLPIKTHIVPERKRNDMEQFLAKIVYKENGQIFYLVPRIESDKESDSTLKDINLVLKKLKNGACADIPVATIHGKMTSDEKNEIMNNFINGNTKILISTTLIEVGVDVPNAIAMVIENAERFGLAQLHQLRGRIGRNEKQGYCFLFIGSQNDTLNIDRIKKFCTTNDGFKIAELDLKLRGPGDVVGFRQSGKDNLKLANILEDSNLFAEINNDIANILDT